jgi:hypothetical protein
VARGSRRRKWRAGPHSTRSPSWRGPGARGSRGLVAANESAFGAADADRLLAPRSARLINFIRASVARVQTSGPRAIRSGPSPPLILAPTPRRAAPRDPLSCRCGWRFHRFPGMRPPPAPIHPSPPPTALPVTRAREWN